MNTLRLTCFLVCMAIFTWNTGSCSVPGNDRTDAFVVFANNLSSFPDKENNDAFSQGLLVSPVFNYYYTYQDKYSSPSGYSTGLDAAFYLSNGVGLYGRAVYLKKVKDAFYDDSGFSADAGISYSMKDSPFYVRGGVSFIHVTNSDGGFFESKGIHLGPGVVLPLSSRLGMRLDGNFKWWLDDDVKISIEAGVGLVFRI